MGRRSPQSVLKRAREQALREKRELKQAKKAARAAARQQPEDVSDDAVAADDEDAEIDEDAENRGEPMVVRQPPAAP
jgi:Spy/CpxP family protein refolding chaperone